MTGISSDSKHQHDYLPAFGHDRLLPLYDLMTKALGVPPAHRTLLRLAGARPGERVLEIGCGTGNLTLMAASQHSTTDWVGLDPDPLALARATRKATRKRADVRFDHGYSQKLPYPDSSFDRVLSSLMLHHLDSDVRHRSLEEVRRVLKPGGALYIVDIGGRLSPSDGFLARRQLGNRHLQDNLGDAILRQCRAAGLTDCAELSHQSTRFGRVTFYRAAADTPQQRPE